MIKNKLKGLLSELKKFKVQTILAFFLIGIHSMQGWAATK